MSTMSSISSNANDGALRTALRANAIFSGATGLVLLLVSEKVASLLGVAPTAILPLLGTGLLLFGLSLLWMARQAALDARQAMGVVLMDSAWVAGSVILLLSHAASLSTSGNWAVATVATVVGLFAIWQYAGIRQMG